MPSERAHRRRGSIAVVSALSMLSLMMMTAVAIDANNMRTQSAQTQAAVDAAALAAAGAVFDTSDRVESRAIAFGELNSIGGHPLNIERSGVEFGFYDEDNDTFDDSADFEDSNAVRVTVTQNFRLLFGGLTGFDALETTRTATVYHIQNWGEVGCGFVSGNETTMNGGFVVDSWNSAEDGAYNGGVASGNAVNCSNGSIRLVGNGTVDGSVYGGFRNDPDVGSNVTVTGDENTLHGELDFPFIDCSALEYPTGSGVIVDATAVNDNASAGLVSGADLNVAPADTITIGPGVFYFDDVDIKGEVIINGPVTICAADDVSLKGQGLVNPGGSPHDLTVFAQDDVHSAGGADFYGAIVANDDITVAGGAQFYGLAAGGDTATFSGTADVHMDESLPLLEQLIPLFAPDLRLVQ